MKNMIFKDYTLFSGIIYEDYIDLFKSPDYSFENTYKCNYPLFLSFQSLFTKFLILKKGQNLKTKNY